MLGNIGPLEIVVVLVIALIVFGPKRLPELGNSLGKGIREFKESVTGDHRDDDSQEHAAQAIGAPKATTTHVDPPTSYRVEADDAKAVHDKTS
jgi:sec-independent protein translocase protein TatA